MEEYHQEGILNYSKPDKSNQFYEANLFLKEATEAMGLPPESGAKMARKLLYIIVRSLPSDTSKEFRSALPNGLRQECAALWPEHSKEGFGAGAMRNSIQETVPLDPIDPEEVASSFWSYLRSWLEQGSERQTELAQRILDDIPAEMARLLGEIDDSWPRDML